jgi:death-on-curing protein
VPVWIPEVALRAMHAALLAEHGGLEGPVDENALGSSLARPQQLHHYGDPPPSIFELAAALGFALAKNHCFRDGNKRISLTAIDVFLQLNGHELVAEEADAVLTIQDLAASVVDEAELARWIEANSQKR